MELTPARQTEFVICDYDIETLFQNLKSRGFELEATRLKADERLEHLFSSLQEAKPCYDLVHRFIALFKRQDQEANETMQAFGRWLRDAKTSGITELARRAKGFSNDQAAIEAALTQKTPTISLVLLGAAVSRVRS